MTPPQLASAILGGALFLLSLLYFVRKKEGRFKALFWMVIGFAMVVAGFQPHIIEYLGADSAELRLRLIVALLSFMVLTVTLEAIRVGRLLERYAFLWLAAGAMLLVGSVFEGVGAAITRVTGLQYDMAVVVVFFSFIILILFSFSAALSDLQTKVSQIARELALAEERLRRVEKNFSTRPPLDPPAPRSPGDAR